MKKIITGITIIIFMGIAYWLISPLWRTKRLDESLPQPSAAQSSAPVGQQVPEIKDNLDTMDPKTKQDFMQQTDKMKDKTMVKADAMPSNQPRVLGEAPLVARAHDVAGKALIVQVGDQKILRFEDLQTINGPDLHIYLSAGLDAGDAVDLGSIRATEGNVNYTIPVGTDTSKYRNVLIWCRPFGVLFSYAQL